MMRKKESQMNSSSRVVCYIVLVLVSIMCLFWFYLLFVNATRSNSELSRGFTPFFSTHAAENWHNLLHGTLPILNGLWNSFFIAITSSVLSVYFSTMTAYAIHAYDFKGKKYIYAFILGVMMIPTQVTVLGFLQLIGKMNMDDSFIPLIVPAIAAPITFFYMKQYMDSSLSLSLIEAARIDGASPLQMDLHITIPLVKYSIQTCVTLAAVFGLRTFEQIYLLTNGGPANRTSVVVLYLYNQMRNNKYGIANASSVMLILTGAFVIVAIRAIFARSKD